MNDFKPKFILNTGRGYIGKETKRREKNASRRLKDVKQSGYTLEGRNYKICPNCGCKMVM